MQSAGHCSRETLHVAEGKRLYTGKIYFCEITYEVQTARTLFTPVFSLQGNLVPIAGDVHVYFVNIFCLIICSQCNISNKLLTEAKVFYCEIRRERPTFFQILQYNIPGEDSTEHAAIALHNLRYGGEIKIVEFNFERRTLVFLVSAVKREGLSRISQYNIVCNKLVLAKE